MNHSFCVFNAFLTCIQHHVNIVIASTITAAITAATATITYYY
jgi:hypothetical protein